MEVRTPSDIVMEKVLLEKDAKHLANDKLFQRALALISVLQNKVENVHSIVLQLEKHEYTSSLGQVLREAIEATERQD